MLKRYFKEHIPTTFFKYGYRLVLFFPNINPQKLNPLLNPETEFSNIRLASKGPLKDAVQFSKNPKDNCLQAIPLVNAARCRS
jgi:hypothetical protein